MAGPAPLVHVRMHGATPPHTYELVPRAALFHGLPARNVAQQRVSTVACAVRAAILRDARVSRASA